VKLQQVVVDQLEHDLLKQAFVLTRGQQIIVDP
jgi:hypothetical protein